MFNASKKNSKLYYEIIQQLYYHKVMSCAEVSAGTGKSMPLIAKALNYLITVGFVVEQGLAPSSGGRRPLTYALKKDTLYMVTVAMDQLSVRVGITDLQHGAISPVEIAPINLKDHPNALNDLINMIIDSINRSGISKNKFIGIGIGMPGFINSREGINYTYFNLPGDESLAQYITQKTGIKTYIDNDSSLIALSEIKFGKARAINDAMVINVGWGIGLGMIINGQIFRGHNGFAGEFSHIPVREDGALCACGKQGCLESEASMMRITEKAIAGIQNGQRSSLAYRAGHTTRLELGESLLDVANTGDQYTVELINEAAFQIGRALAILIHLMNPQVVIISGRGAKVGKLLLPPIQQALNKYCIPRLASDTELLISDLGFEAELIGAGILVVENLSN